MDGTGILSPTRQSIRLGKKLLAAFKVFTTNAFNVGGKVRGLAKATMGMAMESTNQRLIPTF